MYQIKLANAGGTKVVHECQTLEEVKVFTDNYTYGAKNCTEDNANWSRLETYEILPDGNLVSISTSRVFEGK